MRRHWSDELVNPPVYTEPEPADEGAWFDEIERIASEKGGIGLHQDERARLARYLRGPRLSFMHRYRNEGTFVFITRAVLLPMLQEARENRELGIAARIAHKLAK
jgi:hypothetical protein